MKTNDNEYRWNHEEEEQVMMVAADSLVHFADGASSMSRRADQDNDLTALEIARTAYLCMAC
ncbi:MAG: hypothetical protein II141_01780 [Clostridia bacterium]|jgi:hypothetical protein|nr:hypothetical protein [Clostridia bacterium]MBQ9290772.1 hypothetical protein [Clostridia bacterium]